MRRRRFDLRALRGTPGDALLSGRRLFADGAWHQAQVLQRDHLAEGARIEGPAILQQADATAVLEPGSVATVDALGNLRVRP
ncbi:hypothetical protein J4558_27485 [Leptolyngbya sp. 15MV]|nr:hypothetical protein J4558_27485 [Leptolyngbya sp. 15MV]